MWTAAGQPASVVYTARLEQQVARLEVRSPLNLAGLLAEAQELHAEHRLECFSSHLRVYLREQHNNSFDSRTHGGSGSGNSCCDHVFWAASPGRRELIVALLQHRFELRITCDPATGRFVVRWRHCRSPTATDMASMCTMASDVTPPDLRELQRLLDAEPHPPQFPRLFVAGIGRALARLRAECCARELVAQVRACIVLSGNGLFV